jgi:soluble lytic murein transglycosylase
MTVTRRLPNAPTPGLRPSLQVTALAAIWLALAPPSQPRADDATGWDVAPAAAATAPPATTDGAATGALPTGIGAGAATLRAPLGAAAFDPRLPLTEADAKRLTDALAAYERRQIAEGDGHAAEIGHPTARLAAEWAAVRLGAPFVSYRRIMAFADMDGWQAREAVQRRAEEALLADRIDHARTLAHLAGRAPQTAAGRVALALAMLETGRTTEAVSLARRIWREDPLAQGTEERLMRAFGERLTRQDHRNRMEHYLFRERGREAQRFAALAGDGHEALVAARLAVARKASNAAAALAKVPEALRKDTSYRFALAQHHRRADRPAEALVALAGVSRDPAVLVNGDEWWVERRLVARQLLDAGRPADAYAVASQHGASRAQSIIEAEWHAGWIALRFLGDAHAALTHFGAAARLAETPISVARAAYWQGRAADALGDRDAAEAFFRHAASHPVTFYGQLARGWLGLPDLPLADASAPAEPTCHALAAARMLQQAGGADAARALMLELGRTVDEPAEVAQLAALAREAQDMRLLVSLTKSALHRGVRIEAAAYPTDAMPHPAEAPDMRGASVERPMLKAIARQESAFDPEAVSHAGARGLMQLMPATARETARRIGLPFEPARLTRDPAYNTSLGAAHLADLLRDWRGSYVLAFAAYNAGSGNVRDWIARYGDPRDPAVDVIDWIERIPFTETRNYVQRIVENLQVYRARLGALRPMQVMADLARGDMRSDRASADRAIGDGRLGDGRLGARPAATPAAVLAADARGDGP